MFVLLTNPLILIKYYCPLLRVKIIFLIEIRCKISRRNTKQSQHDQYNIEIEFDCNRHSSSTQ